MPCHCFEIELSDLSLVYLCRHKICLYLSQFVILHNIEYLMKWKCRKYCLRKLGNWPLVVTGTLHLFSQCIIGFPMVTSLLNWWLSHMQLSDAIGNYCHVTRLGMSCCPYISVSSE